MKDDKGVSFIGKRRSNGWLIGIFVALMVAIVGLGVAVIVNFVITKKPDDGGVSEDTIVRDEAFRVAASIDKRYQTDLDYSFDDAVADYNEQLSRGTNKYKVLIAMYYASFLRDYDDLEDAVDVMNKAKDFLDGEDAILKMNYYVTFRSLYEGVDNEIYNYYNDIVIEIISSNQANMEGVMSENE